MFFGIPKKESTRKVKEVVAELYPDLPVLTMQKKPGESKRTYKFRFNPKAIALLNLELTGKENIYTNGTILGMSIKELKKKKMEIIEFSGLEPKFLDMPVKNYSSGMGARLGFSVAVHSDADIFLLDEVLAVGDSAFKDKCSDKIDSLMKKNKTFIIVTHNLENMKKVTNRIIYMEKGKIVNETN